ncbi:uncharacterized protein LOC104859387 isoform X3 [Fukomys damarensis]|uniref:uncharacterized protein LOC104859387 isoform X3 n=1 Tax=Fukomys damarensis TaxID=885580 RepID=UPI00053FC3CC|nr:uncharacterized protein LOC104859387 isoform X3 [Fukomys damarensis]
MAANRGVGTLFLVLLLSSWPETNLQPINTSSEARLKENYDSTPRKLENWFSSGHTDRLFSDEEEKETLFQIKSLSALEKIIDSLQRVLSKGWCPRSGNRGEPPEETPAARKHAEGQVPAQGQKKPALSARKLEAGHPGLCT